MNHVNRMKSYGLKRPSVAIYACGGLLAFALSMAQAAPMTFQTLAQRLPTTTNAVVAVNVTKVLQSPYGKREHWAEIAADAWAKQPVMIPLGAKRLIMAADVATTTMNSAWELSLIEMEKMPTLEELTAAEGGHTDRLWDKDAVVSPINAFVIPIEPTVLASITPASRSATVKWVRQPVKPEGYVESTYIKNVVAGLSDKTDIVMALDLNGAFGPTDVRRFLDVEDIKEVVAEKLDETAKVLATMQGITLEVTVGENVTGQAYVLFESDAALLKECAKPVMIAVMKRVGMSTKDVEGWNFVVEGPHVTMRGPISSSGLRELLGLVQSPIPAATVTATSATSESAQPPATPAEASQRYYKSVDMCITNVRQIASSSSTSMAIRNAAKRIDQLPILHVDPALIEWGALVSTKLTQASGVLTVGQAQTDARAAGIMDPEYAYNNPNANATARRNANSQRRQVTADQRAQSYQQAMTILNEIVGTSPKIRAEMVAKYHVEF